MENYAKQSLFKEIKQDLIFAKKYSIKGIILETLFNVNFQALLSYRIQHRIAEWPRGLRLLVLPVKILTEYLTSCQIHYGARIEGGIKLHHCVGVVIGKGVTIGTGTNILQNVTLGTQRLGVEEFPNIGRNAYIYAGAVVVGNIVIGDNVIIGALAMVRTNVPTGKRVFCAPAEII